MIQAIDILCYLFTPEAVKKYWYEQEEILRLIRWWHMEERVRGYTIVEFLTLLDAAHVEKVFTLTSSRLVAAGASSSWYGGFRTPECEGREPWLT